MTSEDIAEVAVVGIPDTLKGQIPLGLCVLKHGMGLFTVTIYNLQLLQFTIIYNV